MAAPQPGKLGIPIRARCPPYSGNSFASWTKRKRIPSGSENPPALLRRSQNRSARDSRRRARGVCSKRHYKINERKKAHEATKCSTCSADCRRPRDFLSRLPAESASRFDNGRGHDSGDCYRSIRPIPESIPIVARIAGVASAQTGSFARLVGSVDAVFGSHGRH